MERDSGRLKGSFTALLILIRLDVVNYGGLHRGYRFGGAISYHELELCVAETPTSKSRVKCARRPVSGFSPALFLAM